MNNILFVDLGTAISVDSNSQTGFSSNFNLFYLGPSIDPNNDNIALWGSTRYTSLSAWQTGRSQDLNSKYGDPLFLDINGADNVFGGLETAEGSGEDDNFGLNKYSPAIDSGNAYAGIFTDILGRPRHDDPSTPNQGIGWDKFVESDIGSNQFSATGTAKNWRTTNYSWQYSLPFTFNFYGKSYNQIYVSTDGFLHFEGPDNRYGDNSIDVFKRNVRIAPLWDNLRTSGTNEDIYIDESVSGQVTIRWAGSLEASPYSKVNFSVTLFSDGRIRFDYGSGNTDLTPTIGLSAGNSEIFVLSSYNGLADLGGINSILWIPTPGLTYFDIGAYEFQGDSGDSIPPKVLNIPILPSSGGETALAFSSIQIQFSEQLDVISARSKANYILIQAGPDETFDTGDDIKYILNPAYAFDSDTVTLETASGILPDGKYRLTLIGTGTIYDTAGNALDGNGDGIGGDNYIHYFDIDRTKNHAPEASDQSVSLDEDGSLVITLSGTDEDGDSLSFSITDYPDHGTISSIDPVTHQLTYIPFANYNGPDSFRFRVDDGKLGVDEGIVNITINPVNDAPVAIDQSVTVKQNGSKLIVLQGTDLETPSPYLSFSISVPPSHGTLTQVTPNSWTYVAEANYIGSDSFTFELTDRGDPDGSLTNKLSETGTVSIDVIKANQKPAITEIPDKTINEGSLLSFTVSASDPDAGDKLTFSLDAGPTGASIHPSTGLFSWQSKDGPDSFTVIVRVTDNGSPQESDTEVFDIIVNNVPPTLLISGPGAIKEGELYTLNLSSSDPGQDTITSWTINWGDGSPEIISGNPASVSHTYLSPGSYMISASATDEDGTYDSNDLPVEVRPLNSPPEANPDSYEVHEDHTLIVSAPGVLINDTDLDENPLIAIIVKEPSYGTLIFNSDGSFTYIPFENFFGTDSFTYVANDGSLSS
ncbi:MAG: Ig-like domain-containing protein, partial [Halobacteria archaeon]